MFAEVAVVVVASAADSPVPVTETGWDAGILVFEGRTDVCGVKGWSEAGLGREGALSASEGSRSASPRRGAAVEIEGA
jgi:hypothetical protein